MCLENGYEQYEVSSFSIHSKYQSIHNKSYWQGNDYLGIGPGAHGRIQFNSEKYRTYCILSPDAWMHSVEKNGNGIERKVYLNNNEFAKELITFGLRMKQGICTASFEKKTGKSLNHFLNLNALNHLVENGFLIQEKDHLRATQKGFQVLDFLMGKLLSG